MKLRNKKTGEVRKLYFEYGVFKVVADNGISYRLYETLSKLQEEWEDYKEPKGIQDVCNVKSCVFTWMGSEEEAEKAVEKLKAWKRLKDKGFKFKGGDDACISYEFPIEKWNSELEKDFELLFGGEE